MGPVDEVVTSPKQAAPPPSLPWDELARVGLMGAWPSAGGPIGTLLTATTRQGLLDCLQRLEGGRLSFQSVKPYGHVTASAALASLEQQSGLHPVDICLRAVGTPLRNAYMVDSLESLRRLDVLYGAGDASMSAALQAARQSLQALSAAGFRLSADSWSGSGVRQSRPVDARQAFEFLLTEGRMRLTDPSGKEREIRNPDDAIVLHHFYAGGGVEHLDAARADTLRTLHDKGFRFRDLYTGVSDDLWFAYREQERSYAETTRDDRQQRSALRTYAFVGRPGEIPLPLDVEGGHDAERFEARVDAAQSVYQQVMASGLVTPSNNDTDWYTGGVLGPALRGDTRFGSQILADSLAALTISELRRNPDQPLHGLLSSASIWLGKVVAVSRTSEELSACCEALGQIVASSPKTANPWEIVDDTVVSLVKAMSAPATPSGGAGSVTKADDYVIVGGVKIPRRRS